MKKIIVCLVVFCILSGIMALPVDFLLVHPEATEIKSPFPETEQSTENIVAESEEASRLNPIETVPAETAAQKAEEETSAATEASTMVEAESKAKAAVPEKDSEEESAEEPEESEEDPDAPRGHNGVPLYFQTDYPNNMYGMGTIANNGCSAACLAMVATYMTGHEYLPDEIARYFGGAAENNIARLENGSEVMQLPYKKADNWHETLAAIHDGKVAIVMVDAESIFTDSQHFIIVTGLNEEGKLMVNDSYEPNYDKWDTQNGLRNGFEPGDILCGYSGAWIYDKSAMPEEPFLYSEPEPVRGEPRYGLELTWEEIQLLAKVVWVESRGESDEGQQAVAEVILNRLVSDKFPDTLKDVVYAQNQFRSAKFLKTAQPYQKQYEIIENALYGPYILPDDVYYFATTAKTEKVWGKIGGHIFCYSDN